MATGEAGIQARWIRRQGSWWRLLAGWVCIGLGLLGMILPMIPGIPLLIFGLVMLSTQHRWAHRAMFWIKARIRRRETER